jgi:hypothetical protein
MIASLALIPWIGASVRGPMTKPQQAEAKAYRRHSPAKVSFSTSTGLDGDVGDGL